SRYTFLPGQVLPNGNAFCVEDLNRQDLAAIFYTSGTTGFPKGAMTTHECFLSNIETCHRCAPIPKDGSYRTLISVPLFHVTGCNSQFLVAARGGGSCVIMPSFDIQSFVRAIPEERITALISVPAIFWYALNQPTFNDIDRSGVRRVMYGG